MITRRTKVFVLISLIVGLIILTSMWLYLSMYVPFHPIVFQNDKLIPATGSVSDSFMDNIVLVLTYYHEPFKIDSNGNIFIRRIRWLDQDSMWTYTNQANNPEIIESHRVWLLEVYCPKKLRDCSYLESQRN